MKILDLYYFEDYYEYRDKIKQILDSQNKKVIGPII